MTEIAETDVFVCDSKCDGKDKVIKKFGKALKVCDMMQQLACWNLTRHFSSLVCQF